MDDQKTMVVSVHAKDCVDYQCRRCGQCCRHIKDAVMVESMDAYRLANYLRGCDPNICTIDDVLTRYCEPMPLTQECFPIFMLKTTGPDDSCIFLKDGLCSIYEARPRTCRLYPFSVGPGERGRDFEYCLCFDHNQQYHFNGGKVSVKDWFYRNFPRMEKEYLKQEYAAITEIGKRMRSISPELCKQMTFQVLFYRYYSIVNCVSKCKQMGDEPFYVHGFQILHAHLAPCHLNRTLHTNLHCPLERAAGLPMIQVQ